MPEAVLVAETAGATPALVGFAEVSRRAYAEGCETSPVGFLEGWYVVPERCGQGGGARACCGRRGVGAWAGMP